MKKIQPCNSASLPCVGKVIDYLNEISGDRIITGQHTQTMPMEELQVIKNVTGKEPALLGFELLSYSPNINYLNADEECLTEVRENMGTLEKAWEWASKGGLITFTWHWFSPLYGKDKAFFSEKTEFDAAGAVLEGTAENEALISDMDVIAGYLKPFCRAGIPILWRPLHESEGEWFWWGRSGSEVYIRLYRLMYERFTGVHKLNNLIWVWNGASASTYPGDDVVDVLSRDLYPPAHTHAAHEDAYKAMLEISKAGKPVILGEIGTLPSPEEIHAKKTGWASFMIWSKVFALTEDFNTHEELKKVYDSPYSITLADLPRDLY